MRIMIAEDEHACGIALSMLLELMGHDVEWLDSGKSLYRALDSESVAPDVLLLDLGLGDEDGVALVERARMAGLSIPPIVVFSARSETQVEDAATQIGAVGVLQKPCTSAQLIAMFEMIATSAEPAWDERRSG